MPESGAPAADPTLRLTLERLLHRLQPLPRTVFVLFEVEGYKHREIAGILGIPESTSQNRPLTASATASLQHLWDGDVSAVSGSLVLRGGSHLSLSASYTRSEASLPGGGFVAHVTGLRTGWAFSTRLAAHAYAQYNSLERRFVANLRLRYIYRPGSDLYVVFNEERGEPGDPRALLSRGFAVKGTWLIRF